VLYAGARYRSQYTDGAGTRVAGSSGGSIDGGISGTIGGPSSLGLVVHVDGRYDTGMDVDNSVITAAAFSGGVTLGVAVPLGPSVLQPFVRAQYGRIDSGPRTGTMSGLTAGLTLTSRARGVASRD
jgi:hypothetical protein